MNFENDSQPKYAPQLVQKREKQYSNALAKLPQYQIYKHQERQPEDKNEAFGTM